MPHYREENRVISLAWNAQIPRRRWMRREKDFSERMIFVLLAFFSSHLIVKSLACTYGKDSPTHKLLFLFLLPRRWRDIYIYTNDSPLVRRRLLGACFSCGFWFHKHRSRRLAIFQDSSMTFLAFILATEKAINISRRDQTDIFI